MWAPILNAHSSGFISDRLQVRSGLATPTKIPPVLEPSRLLVLALWPGLQGPLPSPRSEQEPHEAGRFYTRQHTLLLPGQGASILLLLNQSCSPGAGWWPGGHRGWEGPGSRPSGPWALPVCILKSLMPFISAFLSPVYLLEILLSLLKRRWCSPRGSGRGGSGLWNSAISPTVLGKGERRRERQLTRNVSWASRVWEVGAAEASASDSLKSKTQASSLSSSWAQSPPDAAGAVCSTDQ